MLKKISTFLLVMFLVIGVSIHLGFADEILKPTADGDVLVEAIEKGDVAKVDELLSRKINPNSRGGTNQFMSPLKYAASGGNKHIVENLLKHGTLKKRGSSVFR